MSQTLAPAVSPALVTGRYTFAMDSFRITDTRSRHEDTDYVSISLAVGSAPPMTKTKSMGDLNNGTFKVGLSFDNIAVASNVPVAFTYAIVNNGHGSQADVEKSLEKAGTTLAQKAAEAAAKAIGAEIGSALGASIGTAAVPIVGTALGAVAGWLVGEIGGFLFANCDGPVAAGVRVFHGSDLAAQTSGGKVLTQTDHNPGTDSPTGCGSNSNYFVTWSIRSA
jgi:hypothetical protein